MAQSNFQISDIEGPELLKNFLSYMFAIKGRSPRTVNAYYIDLRFFLRYLKASRLKLPMDSKNLCEIEIDDIPEDMILNASMSDAYGFLNFVIAENSNCADTRARKVSSIRSFYKYIFEKTNKLTTNPMSSLDSPAKKKRLPKYLTLEESIDLLNSISGKHAVRDYCMITFMLNCGMRVSELVNIKRSSFQKDNFLRIVGKGNKERLVYLNNACIAAKEDYDEERAKHINSNDTEYYFLSDKGTPLTTRRVEQLLETHLRNAGLGGRGISPHKLRHTAATLMYQHGNVDIRVLKDVLGHVNLGTTEIYTHIANKQVEQASNASPLADIIHNDKNKK